MPGQHRQQPRAEDIALSRRIRARVMQRTVRHQAVEQPALLEVLDEERELSERRHRRAAVHSTWTRPAKVSATTRPVDTLPTTARSSPIGSLRITSRFVPIPYDNNDLLNPCSG